MIVTSKAEWEDSPVMQESEIHIAGFRGLVYERREQWIWSVTPPRNGRNERGVAATQELAKKAAEDAITAFYSTQAVV